MSVKERIEAIIAPASARGLDAGCEFNGKFWEVWVGDHAGGRENGISLATFLMEQHGKTPVAIPPVSPVPPGPEQDYKAMYDALRSEMDAKALEVEVPMFLKPDGPEMGPPPPELNQRLKTGGAVAMRNEWKEILAMLRELAIIFCFPAIVFLLVMIRF